MNEASGRAAVSTEPSRAIALFGTEEPVAPAKVLRAGPLTVELESGNLRYIRYQDVEVLRGISFLVRDRNWATYGAAIENLKVDQGPDSFTVSYDAGCKDEQQELRYRATITGRADGTLRFAVDGEAVSDFETNRAGFVVLHPLAGVAGEPVEATHTDGTVEKTRFPHLISPAQPIFDIRALAHELLPGVRATCTMEGDAYEMEDQRNWADASYKTYIRPLAKPKPYALQAGEVISQSVSLAFRGAPEARAAGSADGINVALGEPSGRPMPRIGLWVPPEEAERSAGIADRIKALGPSLLLGHLDLRDPVAAAALRHLAALADAVAAPVVLEIVLPNRRAPAEELAAAAVAVAGLELEAVVPSPQEYLKSWQPQEPWPDCPPLEEIYDAARRAFPGVLVGGGMLSYFTELNRKRPPADHIDFVTHATCPIVHDCDDRAVMETLEALPWVAESVRAFAPGKPYRVGPSMLGMRANPYGAAPVPNPDNRRLAMAINDPRQRGLFGAAWNLGYVARLADAGVEVLTLSAPLGPFGVVYARADYPQPWFDEHGGEVYPVYHVIRGLAQAVGRPQLATTTSHPAVVQSVAWRDGSRIFLWLANLTGQPQTVALAGLPAAPAVMARLDLERFVAATAGPDGWDGRETTGSLGTLDLSAYAVARLEFEG
jgi:D-apionolactonase